jgi:hypothetical protein
VLRAADQRVGLIADAEQLAGNEIDPLRDVGSALASWINRSISAALAAMHALRTCRAAAASRRAAAETVDGSSRDSSLPN